jgi:putative tricarboxylic transport membrane protein
MFGVWTAFAFGVIGYICRRFDYPVSPMVLALVLGRMMEINFRRALIISRGDVTAFFTRPFSLVLMIIMLLLLTYPFVIKKLISTTLPLIGTPS